MNDTTATAIAGLYEALPALRLRYCPLAPTARQEVFLRAPNMEVFHGGGAGSGKSIALLIAALQYADVPGYHALILRPSISELQLPGGLIQLAHDWLGPSKARWSADNRQWRFPSGATLTYGYLDTAGDVRRYLGTSYSFLGFDELTSFTETNYLQMFRVLRQPARHAHAHKPAPDGTTLADVPARIRAASNPGGPGHVWVRTRLVDPASRIAGAAYIPARMTDNPHLDVGAYMQTLAHLPRAERERLLHGDWEVPDDGELFHREWFEIIDRNQLPDTTSKVRYWDLAGTAPGPTNRDPDYTCGIRLEASHRPRGDGNFYITDIALARQAPGAIEKLVLDTAHADGREVKIVIEQEPGAAGVSVADHYKRDVLRGFSVYARRVTGSKVIRANPVAAAAENGLVKLVRGRNILEFLDQISSFPNGSHDDCIDALAGAHTEIAHPRGRGSVHVPRGRIPTHTQPRSPYAWTDPMDIHALGATIGVPVHNPQTGAR